jgi:hypothetical protein
MNPALLLLLLTNSGRCFGEDNLLLLTLALSQNGLGQPPASTTPAAPAPTTTATAAPIDPIALLLLLGMGRDRFPRDEDKRFEPGDKKLLERRPGLDDRALLLTLLLSGQTTVGQSLGTLGTASPVPATGTSTIDPTTLLLLALSGGEMFGGRDALRKHFFRQRFPAEEEAEVPEGA